MKLGPLDVAAARLTRIEDHQLSEARIASSRHAEIMGALGQLIDGVSRDQNQNETRLIALERTIRLVR